MENIAAPELPQSRARHRCGCLKTPGIAIHARADTWTKKVTEILQGADQEKKREAVPDQEQVGTWVNGQAGQWVDGWAGRWVGEWASTRMIGWVDEWAGRWVGE